MTWKAPSPSAPTGSNCKLFKSRVPRWPWLLAKHMQCMESKAQRAQSSGTWQSHEMQLTKGREMYRHVDCIQQPGECRKNTNVLPLCRLSLWIEKFLKKGTAGEICKPYFAGLKVLTTSAAERWATWEQTAATKTDTEHKFFTQCELNTLAVNLKTPQHVKVTWNHNVQRDWKSP